MKIQKTNIAFLSAEWVHTNNILILSVTWETGDWGLDGGWKDDLHLELREFLQQTVLAPASRFCFSICFPC